MSRYSIFGLLILMLVVALPLARIFVVPLVVAATFSVLFYPFYKFIHRRFPNKRGFSAFLCCLALFIGLLLPVYILVHIVIVQAVELYEQMQPTLKSLMSDGQSGAFLANIQQSRWYRLIEPLNLDWNAILQQAAQRIADLGTFIINKASVGLFDMLATLFVTFFFMFYFFMDGEAFLRRLKFLSPLRHEYEVMLYSRFLLISRATIKGTLLIGIMQGTLGALAFLILGFDTWVLWGFVMIILSIIPVLGSWLVLVPAALVQLFSGHMGPGITLLAASAFISIIDNLIRPRLVGQGAKMHDVIIFISTIGGIVMFGTMGFIVGPVIAAMLIAIIEIYGVEFKSHLSSLDQHNGEAA